MGLRNRKKKKNLSHRAGWPKHYGSGGAECLERTQVLGGRGQTSADCADGKSSAWWTKGDHKIGLWTLVFQLRSTWEEASPGWNRESATCWTSIGRERRRWLQLYTFFDTQTQALTFREWKCWALPAYRTNMSSWAGPWWGHTNCIRHWCWDHGDCWQARARCPGIGDSPSSSLQQEYCQSVTLNCEQFAGAHSESRGEAERLLLREMNLKALLAHRPRVTLDNQSMFVAPLPRCLTEQWLVQGRKAPDRLVAKIMKY